MNRDKKFFVKTRNWHGKRWVRVLLVVISKLTRASIHRAPDEDWKFTLYTVNAIHAWVTLFLFLCLAKWSGGWTYIQRPGHDLRPGCKIVN